MWEKCPDEKTHKLCNHYKEWKLQHPLEFKKLCKKALDSSLSVFVQGKVRVIIKGKSFLIDGGIKSLEPPCKTYAFSFGDHPFTCENCF